MSFEIKKFPYDTEQLRMDAKGIKDIRINVITGRDKSGVYIFYSPSLNISGYGDSHLEGENSFKENIWVFIEDILELSHKKRIELLQSLGWKRNDLFHKQYSRVFVDPKGDLKGLNIKKPVIQSMETEIAA